jgi:hypothetical protein
MADPKIEVNLQGNTSEIIYRSGTALQQQPPVKLRVNGLITAPADFFEKRGELVDPDKSHLIVDRRGLNITLNIDENDFYGTIISGTLEYNKELADFAINKNKLFSLKELTQLIRMKRMHFEDKEEHNKVIAALNKFFAKTITEVKDEDDRKGNIEKTIKKETQSNTPASFKLDIAIYEGQEKKKLFVDVLADVSDAQAKFWLESVDLVELEYNLANEIIDAQLKRFGGRLVALEV